VDWYFRIEFDESKFGGFSSHLKTPGVQLVIEETKISETTTEIVVVDNVPDKDPLDIYSGTIYK